MKIRRRDSELALLEVYCRSNHLIVCFLAMGRAFVAPELWSEYDPLCRKSSYKVATLLRRHFLEVSSTHHGVLSLVLPTVSFWESTCYQWLRWIWRWSSFVVYEMAFEASECLLPITVIGTISNSYHIVFCKIQLWTEEDSKLYISEKVE